MKLRIENKALYETIEELRKQIPVRHDLRKDPNDNPQDQGIDSYSHFQEITNKALQDEIVKLKVENEQLKNEVLILKNNLVIMGDECEKIVKDKDIQLEQLRNELTENQSDCAIWDIIKSNNELKEQLEKLQDCDLCNRKFDGTDCDIRNCKHFDPAACKILLKELKDADEKLVYVSCQYSKCFEIMTELVEIITELDCDFEIIHTAEQFIKENK